MSTNDMLTFVNTNAQLVMIISYLSLTFPLFFFSFLLQETAL